MNTLRRMGHCTGIAARAVGRAIYHLIACVAFFCLGFAGPFLLTDLFH